MSSLESATYGRENAEWAWHDDTQEMRMSFSRRSDREAGHSSTVVTGVLHIAKPDASD